MSTFGTVKLRGVMSLTLIMQKTRSRVAQFHIYTCEHIVVIYIDYNILKKNPQKYYDFLHKAKIPQ